ncbi:stalk domain-containing protein [Brevibacillus laterosporus]|uniref:stalk domain-containing protein n=1 Tax=Brevibacillus laterosporus TaxID=1465 RepID=UPI003D1E8C40
MAHRANVDGGFFTFDAAAVIKDDRAFVPLEFFSKILGAKVEWVQKDKTVQITKGNFVGGIPRHLIKN